MHTVSKPIHKSYFFSYGHCQSEVRTALCRTTMMLRHISSMGGKDGNDCHVYDLKMFHIVVQLKMAAGPSQFFWLLMHSPVVLLWSCSDPKKRLILASTNTNKRGGKYCSLTNYCYWLLIVSVIWTQWITSVVNIEECWVYDCTGG